MGEREIGVGDRSVMVRDAGDPEGVPVVYFHGTPGSRLDVSFGDEPATGMGVRVISFDRPGYGRSDPGPFSLSRIASDAEAIADGAGVGRFAALGWSGGGPFALAAAAVLGERVTRAGVVAADGPVQQVPGTRDRLDENDLLALSFLPGEPARAAGQFLAAGAALIKMMMSARDDEQAYLSGMAVLLGDADADVFCDPALRHCLFASQQEALRQGPMGMAWDQVAFVGPWDVDLAAVRCRVHLWYGERDPLAPPANGQWLRDHLADADLVIYSGEGHLVAMRHWQQILHALTG
jgi:pimeloyl-ACP methyl ester carboxylesterase